MSFRFNRFAFAMGQMYEKGWLREQYDLERWNGFLEVAFNYVIAIGGGDPGDVCESHVYFVLGEKGKGKGKGTGKDVSMGKGKGKDPEPY